MTLVSAYIDRIHIIPLFHVSIGVVSSSIACLVVVVFMVVVVDAVLDFAVDVIAGAEVVVADEDVDEDI